MINSQSVNSNQKNFSPPPTTLKSGPCKAQVFPGPLNLRNISKFRSEHKLLNHKNELEEINESEAITEMIDFFFDPEVRKIWNKRNRVNRQGKLIVKIVK